MSKIEAVHSFTVFPADMNYGNRLFGGKVLAEIDVAAAKVVRRALYGTEADTYVTASFDRVDFKAPGFLGDLITMTAKIVSLGKSSLTVRVVVKCEDSKGAVTEICTATAVFVAIKNDKSHPHGLSFTDLETK